MAVQIQIRRGTAAAWTSADPTLAAGEFAVETDTDKYKIGDGSTAWTSLSYSSLPSGSVTTAGGVTITGTMTHGADGTGADVRFNSGTAGDYAMWDASEEKLILEGTNGATVLDITDGNVVIADGTLTVGSDGAGEDVVFYSATAGDNLTWSSASECLTITGTNGQDALAVADGDVSITDKLTVTGQIVTHLTVETESGTTHAPALGDENKYILTTHGTGITVTLPQDSAQAFAIGTTIYYERNGAGTLTFAAGTGATITSKDDTKTCADRYTTVAAVKIGTNAWSLIGNIG